MNELALFAGAGGGILGGNLLGWTTVCAVEIADYPRKVLFARQRDGVLPKFPIWDDISTFDGKPWRGRVDIVTGGFPCQDISATGKGAGIGGEKSGLWGEMARVVDEVRPRFAFVENSPMLTSRGLGTVLGDLARMGYNARWCVLGADDVGSQHERKRIWILAYTDSMRKLQPKWGEQNERRRPGNGGQVGWWTTDPADIPDTGCEHGPQGDATSMAENPKERSSCSIHDKPGSQRPGESPRPFESSVGRMAHGVANWVVRLEAIGNGQVPAVAAIAFSILVNGL